MCNGSVLDSNVEIRSNVKRSKGQTMALPVSHLSHLGSVRKKRHTPFDLNRSTKES